MGYDHRDNAKKHTPADGDTLESIAKQETAAGNPITWQEIARFNWGTDNPETVDEFLRDELGAYVRGQNKRFVLSADATVRTPLLIPKLFQKAGLATTRTHQLRVRKKDKPPKQFESCTRVEGVTFEFDSDKIRSSETADVEKAAAEIKAHPDAKAMIFGHTDKVGDDAYNKGLSERRAKSLFTYLTTKSGVDPGQFMGMQHMGCGEFNPEKDTEAAHEPNRRVTVFLFNPDRPPNLPCVRGDLTPCRKQVAAPLPRNKDSFHCSFYDSIARDCPAEGGAPPAPAVSVKIAAENGTDGPCSFLAKGIPKKFKAVGAPAGGTFKWTVSGTIAINGSDTGEIVTVVGNTTSAALKDCELKVQYTVSGQSATAELKLTVVEVKKITATIKSTPALTARAGTPAPADYTFISTEKAETFAGAKTLVLMRGDLQEVALEVEVEPAATPMEWLVKRAADDAAGLGAGTPKITPEGDPKKAKLKCNETGSFTVRAYAQCPTHPGFVEGDALVLLPVVLAKATLVGDNSVTHTAHINPSVAGGRVRLRTGSFDITNPNTEAIHMNATVDVVTGGADGRRLIANVFGGWVNDERANENIRASYAGGHAVFSIFASNRASATGAGNTFLPGDPAPVILAPPFLDSGRNSAGTGGNTATLTRSRIRSRTNQPLGQRWIVESIDSPGDSALLVHPSFGTRIQRYHFELKFSCALSFWTNQTGADGATGDPADRVYAVLRFYHWDMIGEWTVAADNTLTNVTAMAVTISNQATHDPNKESNNAGSEVRPPTGLSLLANDART